MKGFWLLPAAQSTARSNKQIASPDSLRAAITALYQAIADHQDPQAKATLTSCLQNMLKVQASDHQNVAQPAAQQVAQALGGSR